MNVFVQHFNTKNTTNFRQRFQMIYVNDKWSQRVIQNGTQTFQISAENIMIIPSIST